MNYEIRRWFGDSVMIFTIDNYESINKEIKDIIIKDVESSQGMFATTTDIMGKDLVDNLHKNKNFDKLFKEIEKAMTQCLKEHEYNLDVIDVYITKAWATLTQKDQFISEHRHSASHFSLVYYVEAEDQGNLVLKKTDPVGLFTPSSTQYFKEYNDHNISTITYGSRTGDLVIFPSNMVHFTEVNKQENPRISIGIDILLTMKEGITSEHNLPNPKTWKKI
jgi:uncharacterized protein (TIGR02466 family)